MIIYSTNQAAKKLGITGAALSKYIKAGKVPKPNEVQTGWKNVHAWSEEDIEQLRELLPRIANGRKTRHRKQHSAFSTQHSVKAKAKSETKQSAISTQHSVKAKAKPKTKKQPQARVATATSTPVPHEKKQLALSSQQSAKTKPKKKKPQPRAAALHKKK